MSKNYVLKSIYEYLYKFYGITAKVAKITESAYSYDLGNNCRFYLLTDRFHNQADLNAFTIDLSQRLNAALST